MRIVAASAIAFRLHGMSDAATKLVRRRAPAASEAARWPRRPSSRRVAMAELVDVERRALGFSSRRRRKRGREQHPREATKTASGCGPAKTLGEASRVTTRRGDERRAARRAHQTALNRARRRRDCDRRRDRQPVVARARPPTGGAIGAGYARGTAMRKWALARAPLPGNPRLGMRVRRAGRGSPRRARQPAAHLVGQVTVSHAQVLVPEVGLTDALKARAAAAPRAEGRPAAQAARRCGRRIACCHLSQPRRIAEA